MSARGACRILERVLAHAAHQSVAPLLLLAWAAQKDEDAASSALALQLVMMSAGEPLTKWWGKGRTAAELADLFQAALTDAQIKVIEEI